MKILVLASGGLDSTVLLHKAVKEVGAENVVAMNTFYGQKHAKEMEYAKWQCEHLGVGENERQRGVLGQRDDLVGDRREDTLDHLREYDLAEGLGAAVSEDFGGFILTDRNGLDTGAVDLCKVGGIVDGKSDDSRPEAPRIGDSQSEYIVRTEEYHNQLEHQWSAAQHGDDEIEHHGQRAELGHAAEADDQTQRHGEDQGQYKQDQGGADTGRNLSDN